jgi:hypothetical protein
VYLGTLRLIQFHRGTAKTPVGAPADRYHHFQVPLQFHHDRRWQRLGLALSLRLQKQLRLIQKPIANCRCGIPPGRIQLTGFTSAHAM